MSKKKLRNIKQEPMVTYGYIKRVAVFLLLSLIPVFITYQTYLAPKIEVEHNGNSDKSKLFSAMFTLSNKGQLPIYDIETLCKIENVRYADPTWKITNIISENGSGKIQKIDNDDSTTIQCPYPVDLGKSPESAVYTILVNFRYLKFLHSKNESRFETIKDADGNYLYLRKALSK